VFQDKMAATTLDRDRGHQTATMNRHLLPHSENYQTPKTDFNPQRAAPLQIYTVSERVWLGDGFLD